MKKFLAFILLLCHMNTSMFLPQMDEQDEYDASGNQIDDINSVVEYIEVALGYDNHADDEDDDNGQHFVLIKVIDYFYHQPISLIKREEFAPSKSQNFSGYIVTKIPSPSLDILTPPPKA